MLDLSGSPFWAQKPNWVLHSHHHAHPGLRYGWLVAVGKPLDLPDGSWHELGVQAAWWEVVAVALGCQGDQIWFLDVSSTLGSTAFMSTIRGGLLSQTQDLKLGAWLAELFQGHWADGHTVLYKRTSHDTQLMVCQELAGPSCGVG